MKNFKIVAIIIFIALISLTGCKKNPPKPTATSVNDVENWLKDKYSDELIIDDFETLPTNYNDTNVTISWESSNSKRIDNTGKIVSRDVKKITDITLTYTITNEDNETLTGNLDFKLYPRTFVYMQNQFESQFPERLAEDMSDYLETEFNDFFTITWSSSNEDVFTNNGEYIRPKTDTPVVISYRIEADETHYVEQSFEIMVLSGTDEEKIDMITDWLKYEKLPDLNISSDIELPTTHPDYEGEIVWTTSNSRVIDTNGKVTQYVFDRYVEVQAFIYYGDMVDNIIFWFKVHAKDISKMSEAEILENFVSAIAEEEVGRVIFDEYSNITQSYNSLFFFDNTWSERVDYLIAPGQRNRPGTIMPSVEFIVCHDTANNNAGAYNHIGYITSSAAGSTSWHYSCGANEIYHHIPDNEVAHHAGDGTKSGYKLMDSGVKATVERPHLTVGDDRYYYFNGVKSNLMIPSDAPNNAQIASSGLYYEIGPNGNYWLNNNWWSSTYKYIGNLGGNLNSIGIESMVEAGSDYIMTFRNFADLVAHLLVENNLDVLRVMQHNNISGKDCPAAIRDQSYWQVFRDLISLEKFGMTHFEGLTFEWKSQSDILSDKGVIAKNIGTATSVNYAVIIKRGDNILFANDYTTKLIADK